jgi:acyl carrier protein
MYSKELIEAKVKEIIASNSGLNIDSLEGTALLKEDLGIDSFDSLRIIFEIENEFDLDIPRKSILNIRNINDIVTHIYNYINNNP